MKVIEDILEFPRGEKNNYIAIGAFDGIHLGHKEIIQKTVEEAKNAGGKSVVFTFQNHPLEVINPKKEPKLLTNRLEKEYLLKDLGVDYVIFQRFTPIFAYLSKEDFVKKILSESLGAKKIFVGFNFFFGHGGSGSIEDLKSLSLKEQIEVEVTAPIKMDGETISSTVIRNHLYKNEILTVNKLLGHNFLIGGKVVMGRQIARTLGYPTANLEIQDKIYPNCGIYGVSAYIEGESEHYHGVINIGRNPTLKPGEYTIELYIFDFDRDIYGKKLYIFVEDFIRDEETFANVSTLIDAIAGDVKNWKDYLLTGEKLWKK